MEPNVVVQQHVVFVQLRNFKEKVYGCKVTSCNVTERGSAVTVFKGNHEAQKSNKSVKGLFFKNTKLYYLPKNLTKIFPNLVFLSVTGCELKELSADDLAGLEKLECVNLTNNHITTVPQDLLENMKNLKKVCFDNNMIQKFDANVLKPIKDKIERFAILNNPGVNECFIKQEADIERRHLSESKKFDSKRFGDLFTSGKYSDFSIKAKGKEYKVHKNILASMSSVIDKLFSEDTGADPDRELNKIENFSEGAVEKFMLYFYTRKTPSDENAAELLKLAVEFDVPDLKLRCEDTLVQTINPESARRLYNFAVQHSLPKLKQKAFAAIKKRYRDIGDSLSTSLDS